MRKIFLISLATFLFINYNNAQQNRSLLYFRLGGTFLVSWKEKSNFFYLPCITAVPGIRLMQTKDFAFVLSAPISVGPSFRDLGETYFGIDCPAMAEFHFGSASGNTITSNIGFMAGAGVAYHLAGQLAKYSQNLADETLDFLGYRFMAGVTFGKKPDTNIGGDRILVGLLFGKTFNGGNKYVTGVHMAFTLGNFKKFVAKSG